MKVLFLDDSYLASHTYQGYGGYCVDAQNVRQLSDDIRALKRQKRIPWHVELKWSPPRQHYLRRGFKGSRQDLNRAALGILKKHDARLFCVIHDLSQCYGVTTHGWSMDQTKLWAAKQQMKYLAERFQHTFLETDEIDGIIVSDNYASRRGERSIVKNATVELMAGTFFQKLDRISMPPLMADSKYCFPIQLADLVAGITVAFFAGGKYATELFPEIAQVFACNPQIFSSSYTTAVVGVGIKLFPANLKKNVKGILADLDSKYRVSGKECICQRKPKKKLKRKLKKKRKLKGS